MIIFELTLKRRRVKQYKQFKYYFIFLKRQINLIKFG